ncbi:MAG TPA: hypothetical protein VL492_09645 [Methylovirgula sp.]|nr:hypothetical protein [Methylovirgula sp.]
MHEHQHGGMGDGKARMQKPMEPMTMQLVGAAEIQLSPGAANLPAMPSQRDRDSSPLL